MSPLADSERASPSTATAACCGVVGAGPVVTSDGGAAEGAGGVEGAADACGDREARVPAGSPPPRASAMPAISAITIAAATTGQTQPRRRCSDAALLTRWGMTVVRSSGLGTSTTGGTGPEPPPTVLGCVSSASRTASADFGRADGSLRSMLATSAESCGDTATPSSSSVGGTACTC